MTDNARWRRQRERRRLGLVSVTIGDDREPTGVRRGEVSTGTARRWLRELDREMEERDAGGDDSPGT